METKVQKLTLFFLYRRDSSPPLFFRFITMCYLCKNPPGSFAALRHDGTVVSWGIPRSGGDSSEVQDQCLVLQHLGPPEVEPVSLPGFTLPETNSSSPLKIGRAPKGNFIFKSLIFFLGELRVPLKSDQF